MQLLVSDYDGTYSRSQMNIQLNNYYIKKWIQKGNKFMISTGRPFTTIHEETDKNNIPYDYLSCVDGGIVYDQNHNILGARYINYDIYNELLALATSEASINDFRFVTPFEVRRDNKFKDQILEYDLHLPTGHEDMQYLVNKTKKLLSPYLNKLDVYSLDFGDDGDCFIVIRPIDTSKPVGIKIVQDICNLPNNKIYVVGDGENDLEMINKYIGYRIKGTLIYEENIPEIRNVRDLVKLKIK